MFSVRSLFPVLNYSSNIESQQDVIFLGKPDIDFSAEKYNKIRLQTKASKIFRLSVFLTQKNKLIFTTPCGPDKSAGLEDLSFCVHSGLSFIRRLGIEPQIGIISGGRGGDLGRSAVVDQTIHDAESLLQLLETENISAKHYTILIEDAVKEANFLILPDSLSGEMILKTVAGIGTGHEIGNVLLLKCSNGNTMASDLPIYIEQMTKNADKTDALILKEALLKK